MGRHFLQIPGPTACPEEVLRAISAPTIDHRGPGFRDLALRLLPGVAQVFGTRGPVVIYPSSGTGAWEAALVNTLSPGDRVLMYETGHFSSLWSDLASRLGLDVDLIPGTWAEGIQAAAIAERLAADPDHLIKAVCCVHNETSTGVTSDIAGVRSALDQAEHPALLLVDTVSSLGSIEYHHDSWGVDVTIGGSQKGLLLPPGLGFNALSQKAIDVSADAGLPRSYWDWEPILSMNASGYFPYTPATNLLFGLEVAIDLLLEEGLPEVWARHARHAEATRAAARGWGLDLVSTHAAEHSNTLTALRVPAGIDADEVRATALRLYDISLGAGLGRLAGSVFRIGHLGDLNDLTLAGALSGVELGLRHSGVSLRGSGVADALDVLALAQ